MFTLYAPLLTKRQNRHIVGQERKTQYSNQLFYNKVEAMQPASYCFNKVVLNH